MSPRPRKPYCDDTEEVTFLSCGHELIASRYKENNNISIFLIDSSGWKDVTELCRHSLMIYAFECLAAGYNKKPEARAHGVYRV